MGVHLNFEWSVQKTPIKGDFNRDIIFMDTPPPPPQVEFPVHALSENTNPYEEVKKWLSPKCCHFVINLISRYRIASCKCPMCLHCVCKVSDANRKKP